MQIAIREAKNNLSKYGDVAHDGKVIVVTKNGKPWFDMIPHRKKKRRTKALENVKPTIKADVATAPLDEGDLPGWT